MEFGQGQCAIIASLLYDWGRPIWICCLACVTSGGAGRPVTPSPVMTRRESIHYRIWQTGKWLLLWSRTRIMQYTLSYWVLIYIEGYMRYKTWDSMCTSSLPITRLTAIFWLLIKSAPTSVSRVPKLLPPNNNCIDSAKGATWGLETRIWLVLRIVFPQMHYFALVNIELHFPFVCSFHYTI